MAAALGRTGARIVGVGAVIGADRGVVVAPPEHEADRFEIGSITKVVTGTVLARLVLDGTTSLDAPIGTWLDAGDNGGITLEELATHTSGLPRLAPNAYTHPAYDPSDPYAAFDAALAEAGLRGASRTAAGEFLYSNFGYQLLGLCIERAAGRPLSDLFDEVVLGPAGMTGATADHSLPVLQGDDENGPVPNWTLLLQGPGGINATISDLLALVEAVITPPDPALAEALDFALEPRADGPGAKIGLGWGLHPAGLACAGGGTAGFSTYVAASRSTGRGVAIATNRHDAVSVQRVALAAAQGDDSAAMVPAPLEGDTQPFEARAVQLFGHFVARDFASARTMMRPETAESLTEDLLREGWAEVAGSCGDLHDPQPQETVRDNAFVRVTLMAPGSSKPLTMRVWFDADLRVGGVHIS